MPIIIQNSVTTQFATPEALIKSGMGEGAKFDSYHTKR